MTPTFPASCIRYQVLETKRDTKAAASPIDLEEDRAQDAKRKRISQFSPMIGFQNFHRREQPIKKVTPLLEDRKENIRIDLNSSPLAPSPASIVKGTRSLLPLDYSVPKVDSEDQNVPASQPESDFEKWDKANFKGETIKQQTSHILEEARQAFETGLVHIDEIEIKRYWNLQFPLGGEKHRCVKPEELHKLFEGFLSEESEDEYAPDPFSRRARVPFETFRRVVQDAEAQIQEVAKIREAFIKDWIKLLKSRGIPVDETVASFIQSAVGRDLRLILNYPEYAEKMLAAQRLEDSLKKDKMIRGIAESLLNEARLLIFI